MERQRLKRKQQKAKKKRTMDKIEGRVARQEREKRDRHGEVLVNSPWRLCRNKELSLYFYDQTKTRLWKSVKFVANEDGRKKFAKMRHMIKKLRKTEWDKLAEEQSSDRLYTKHDYATVIMNRRSKTKKTKVLKN